MAEEILPTNIPIKMESGDCSADYQQKIKEIITTIEIKEEPYFDQGTTEVEQLPIDYKPKRPCPSKKDEQDSKEEVNKHGLLKPAAFCKIENHTLEGNELLYEVPISNPQDDSEPSQEISQKTTCKICSKKFASPRNVQRHMQVHTEKKYKCQVCRKNFIQEKQLERHLARHKTKNYACGECGKVFSDKSKLKQHATVHVLVKPYLCEVCHRSFATEQYWLKHKNKGYCKRPIDQPVVCPVCFLSFAREFELRRHSKKHETERPYTCDICGGSFKYKSTLIKHIDWHSGLKPFKCKVCDKRFSTAGMMKPHMRVHTGEKPYQCSICNKTFSHKNNMQRHTMRHAKEKNLTCNICWKVFPRESRLIYHMRIHLDDKGFFPCHVCPKRFSHKQNVLRHYEKKHPGQVYQSTDTDAKVALRVWESFKSNFNLPVDENEPEEILG